MPVAPGAELFGTSSAVVHRFLLPSTLHVSEKAQDDHDDEDDQESKQGKVLLV
jgi:hypothetical protein